MKKNLKLVLALIVAAMMIVSSISALAVDDLEVNGTLTVEGLDKGDGVKYYKILKWDQDAERVKDSKGNPIGWDWAKTSPTGLTDNDLLAIVGEGDNAGQISAALADKIAAAGFAQTGTGTADDDGKWTDTVTEPGLYMVVVEAKTSGTMYNPIFVAANFKGTNEVADSSNSIKVSEDELSYQPAARAKKSTIPLDKKAKGHEDSSNPLNDLQPEGVDVGEVVDFEVTTKIPKFPADYTNPKFAVKDTLVGLTLNQSSIEVYAGKDASGTKLTANTDYTLSDVSASGYTVTFTKTYLDSVADAGQDIFIKYNAEVSDSATKIINQDKNTVDLIFSTSPDDTNGHGRKRDVTNHYTFSIDANLLGDGEVEHSSTEAIKVGKDKEGNDIMESKSYWNSTTFHAALDGAEFGLYKTKAGAQYETASDLYINDVFNGKVTSDSTGRLTIKGLDEGTYWLKELKAPTGFIRWQEPIEVKIEATYSEPEATEVTETVDGVEVTYYTRQLLSYKVTIGGSETSYTIVNSLANITESKVKREPGSSDKEIVNTKGVELPSTGGMGTTIFYVGGSILVLAAAILLVTKRRMGVED